MAGKTPPATPSSPSSSTGGGSSGDKSAITNKSKDISIFSKIYLIIYNVAQVYGWSCILIMLVRYYTTTKKYYDGHNLWYFVGLQVLVFQTAALLEIFHAAIGIVKSNVILTTFQVLSRVVVVWGALVAAAPETKLSPGIPLALFAWSVTEIIRYAFYALNLISCVPYFLVYLRYTTFIILYPIGVTGELLCFYYAKVYATKNPHVLDIEMPNKFNFTFSYLYFVLFVMFLYIPLFPQLYLHMFAQRKKVLGGGGGNKEDQKIKTK